MKPPVISLARLALREAPLSPPCPAHSARPRAEAGSPLPRPRAPDTRGCGSRARGTGGLGCLVTKGRDKQQEGSMRTGCLLSPCPEMPASPLPPDLALNSLPPFLEPGSGPLTGSAASRFPPPPPFHHTSPGSFPNGYGTLVLHCSNPGLGRN